jgi:hypothetical protein
MHKTILYETGFFLKPRVKIAPFTFAIAFSAKKQACGPEARALRGKSIGPVNSDCGGGTNLSQPRFSG